MVVKTVLVRKIKIPRVLATEIDDYLRSNLTVVKPANIPANVCRDSTDLAVIGTAVAARAEYLVTGDSDLLSLKRYRKVRIVSPRQFWEAIRRKGRKR